MAIADGGFTQDASTFDATTGTTKAVTRTVAAGSVLLLFVTWGNEFAISSVVGSLNGAYSLLDAGVNTGGDQAVAGYAFINSASGSETVTVTFAGVVDFRAIWLEEITGAGTGAIDAHGTRNQIAAGTGTDAVTSGNVTSTTQPALVFGFSYEDGGVSTNTGTGFTSAGTGWGTSARSEAKRVTATGTQVATFTAQAGQGASDMITFVVVIDEAGAGGGSGAISGTAAGVGGETGALVASVSGTSAGAGGQTGNLTGKGALAGTSAGVGNETGTLTGKGALAGTAAGVGGGTGAMAAGAISGTSAGVGNETGNLTGKGALAGTSTGTGGATGNLTGKGALAGTAAGVGGQTGNLKALSGTSAGTGGGTGNLKGTGALAGTSTGVGGETGALTGKGALAGTAAGAGGERGTINPFPVAIHASGRYLVDVNGQPFPILGSSGWFIPLFGTVAEQNLYLDNVASLGVTGVLVQSADHGTVAIASRTNATEGSCFDIDGNLPWTNTLSGGVWSGSTTYSNINNDAPDFSTPNTTYFARIKAYIDNCASRGILVFFFHTYPGFGADVWLPEMVANDAASGTGGHSRAYNWGTWIATYLASCTNIVWVNGGDTGTATGGGAAFNTAEENATLHIAQAIKASSSAYHTGHWNGASIATDEAALASLMDLEASYDSRFQAGYELGLVARTAYSHSPAMVAFEIEQAYEEPTPGRLNPASTEPNRRFDWRAFLSTIGGYFYGHTVVWGAFSAGEYPSGWQAYLSSQGATDAGRLNAFIRSWPWHKLVPSGLGGQITIVTANAGTPSAADYVASAATLDGTLCVIYASPGASSTFTVDSTVMSVPYRARWFDPTNSTYTLATGTQPFANTGTRTFTIPGTNAQGSFSDWALVLDDAPIVGTSTGTGAATGNLTGKGALAGTAAGVGGETGAMAQGAISGTSAGVGGATGNLTGKGALAGTAAGVGSETGTVALSGTSAGVGGETGGLTGAGALAGSSVGAGGETGNLTGAGTVAGTSTGVGGGTGNLTGTGVLAGTSAGVGSETGALGSPGALAGSSAGTGNETGALAGAGALAGTAAGVGSETGTPTGAAPIAGTSAGVGNETGALTGKGALAGTATGVGGQVGNVVQGAIAGTAAGTGGATGTLTGKGAVAGSSAGVGGETGALAGTVPAAGTSAGVGGETGALTGAGALAGTAAGVGGASGTPAGTAPLAGTSTGTGGESGALAGSAPVGGTGAGVGGETGALTGKGALAGTSAGVGGETGNLAASTTSTSTGQGGGTGSLSGTGALAGTSAGTGGAAGGSQGSAPIAGTSAGTGGESGTMAAANFFAPAAVGPISLQVDDTRIILESEGGIMETRKRHDTAYSPRFRFKDKRGPINLDGATVTFIMTNLADGSLKAKAACAVDDQSTGDAPRSLTGKGWCQYNYAPADVDTSGDYLVEVEAKWLSGQKMTGPSYRHNRLTILDDLDDE